MNSYFENIVYSAANEDPTCELRALSLSPKDRVLCITGSGARPLDLLLGDPGHIVSIDFNPRQQYLLELKMAAISCLEHKDLLAFLGVTICERRWSTFQTLEDLLSEEARKYWYDERRAVIKGVLYCGLWESFMRVFQWILWPRKRTLDALFESQDLRTQREIWQKRWRNWMWVGGVKMLGWKWVWRYLFREPGVEYVHDDFPVVEYVLGRFDHIAYTQLWRDNPYLNLLLRGGYHVDALPMHLRKEHLPTIRERLERIEIVTESLQDHLHSHPNTYTAFSVSDFSSYADEETYKKIWAGILHAAQEDAKVCERFCLVHFQPELFFPGQIRRDATLEKELAYDDHTFFYLFNCARVKKQSS